MYKPACPLATYILSTYDTRTAGARSDDCHAAGAGEEEALGGEIPKRTPRFRFFTGDDRLKFEFDVEFDIDVDVDADTLVDIDDIVVEVNADVDFVVVVDAFAVYVAVYID